MPRPESSDGEGLAEAAFSTGSATQPAGRVWTHCDPQEHQVLLDPTRLLRSVQPTKVSDTKPWKKLTESSAEIERSQATTDAASRLTG